MISAENTEKGKSNVQARYWPSILSLDAKYMLAVLINKQANIRHISLQLKLTCDDHIMTYRTKCKCGVLVI